MGEDGESDQRPWGLQEGSVGAALGPTRLAPGDPQDVRPEPSGTKAPQLRVGRGWAGCRRPWAPAWACGGRGGGCGGERPLARLLLPSQETPTNELSVQGPPEVDTDPSTPPAPPTPPHPATPGDGFPSNDSGFGEGRGLREGRGLCNGVGEAYKGWGLVGGPLRGAGF